MSGDTEHSDHAAQRGNSPVGDDLPPRLRVVLDPGTELLPGNDSNRVALGGSPLRLIKLPLPAAGVVENLVEGMSIAEAATAQRRSNRSVARLVRRLLDAGMAHPRWGDPADGPSDGDADGLSDVTIVIPVHQRAEALGRLLGSMGGLLTRVAEVIVVDDGSSDGSGAVAATFGARVIRRDSPSGPAAARNAGLAEVRTGFTAFIDSDCEVSDDWLTPLLRHFGDPALAVVAPRIGAVPPGPHAGHGVLHAYEQVNSSLDLGPSEGRVRPRTRIAYVPAAALVVRTGVIRGVGGFNAAMHVGEDVDLLWRLCEKGHGIRYEPGVTVLHDHRTAFRAFVNRRFDYGTSAAMLSKRHPGQVPPVAVSAWSVAAWALTATLTPLGAALGAAAAVGSAAALPRKLSVLAEPGRKSWELALRGHMGAGRQLGSAVWRSYLPLAVGAALISRRARWILLASALGPNLQEWRERHPALDPVRYVGIRLVDDASYCAGVWSGCYAEKTVGPLVPDLASWPGKRGSAADAIGSAGKTGER